MKRTGIKSIKTAEYRLETIDETHRPEQVGNTEDKDGERFVPKHHTQNRVRQLRVEARDPKKRQARMKTQN